MVSPQTLETLAVIGIFLVRFGVPLLLSAGIAWWLIHLDQRWRQQAPHLNVELVAAGSPASIGHARIIAEPCWVYRACPDNIRDKCPAYTQPEIPCWLARLRNDGCLAKGCRCCSIFATSHIPAAAAD